MQLMRFQQYETGPFGDDVLSGQDTLVKLHDPLLKLSCCTIKANKLHGLGQMSEGNGACLEYLGKSLYHLYSNVS